MKTVNVVPKQVTFGGFPDAPFTETIDVVNLHNLSVDIDNGFSVQVAFGKKANAESSSYNIIRTASFVSTKAEYDAWGTDDNYVIDTILTKYGLTRSE